MSYVSCRRIGCFSWYHDKTHVDALTAHSADLLFLMEYSFSKQIKIVWIRATLIQAFVL